MRRSTVRFRNGLHCRRSVSSSSPPATNQKALCPPRARTRWCPQTSSGSQTTSKLLLTSEAAVDYRPCNDLLSGWSRVRVAFGAQVIYQPRRPTDEPPGKGGAFAPIRRDDEHQGDEHLENGPRGGSRPRAPRVWLRSPRFFTPYRPTRTRQDLPCTSAGTPHPRDRRAISVQLASATSGLSRSLADTPTRRSGHVEGRSRTDSQADTAGSIPVAATGAEAYSVELSGGV